MQRRKQIVLQIFALLSGITFATIIWETQAQDIWRDPSPHKILFVEVQPGVRLEVLDWGGTGRAVFLLAGHGDTGHIFDDFAPLLARHYHVMAITRRGFGASSQPQDGYDFSRMANDIVAVADSLRIKNFDVVGHSIAGDELNRLSRMFPKRIHKLVYLEAAYDRVESERMEAGFHLPHALPQPSSADLSSPAVLTAYLGKTECNGIPEANIRAARVFAPDGHYLHSVTPDLIVSKVAVAVEHPLYSEIQSPALAIYAVKETSAEFFPVYDEADPETRSALDQMAVQEAAFQKAQRNKFRNEVHNGKVIEIRGANHYVFISNRDEVERDVERFLSGAVMTGN